ncbi:Cell envelope-associated transcriptional attenuator LytR-CpsA-Psr, subfamily M (as in PMID19099556) [Richelia intracellularis]|nr:Cell envelope-associated transcriptional attenuator LytR-CpsA-Psr, subfamily M (as in PMID19099556) [Richelia intracellularis]
MVKQVQGFKQKRVKKHKLPRPLHRRNVQEPQADMAHNLISSTASGSSIPSQLFSRLGLSMPRWLFWILTIFVGLTLSGLLVSTLALWTPLWSGTDKTEEELGWSQSHRKQPIAGELWRNISEYKLTQPMNILVLGIEPVRGSIKGSPESFSAHSDTILLVRFNPRDKTVRVLSIPRDTMISVPEKGLTKVSSASADGGVVLAARVVSRTLNNAPIHRYIRISTNGLQELVDQLGGVEVFVPKSMAYQDSTGDLSVNLANGWQTLNGEQALNFARFREEGTGDLGRVQRQQTLLIALRERLLSPSVLPRLPQLTRIMGKYFDTNLKMEEIMALVNFGVNLEQDKLQMTILPGIFSRLSKDPDSYWLDLTGKAKLLSDYVGVEVGGLKADNRSLTHLKIAIQNATKKSNLTKKAIAYFQQQGFKQVYGFGNWSDNRTNTKIIVQKGNLEAGEQIQQMLGFGTVEVSATGDLKSDITIRVGKDWQ